MATNGRRIGRFELHQLLDDSHSGRFDRGIETITQDAVVVQSLAGPANVLNSFVSQARLADRLGMAPRARLVTAGLEGDRAYAAYRIPAGARSLASLIDGETGAPLGLAQRLAILAAVAAIVRRGFERREPLLPLSPDTIWISDTSDVDVLGLLHSDFVTLGAEERLRIETRRLVDIYGALMSGALHADTASRSLPEGAEGMLAALASHFPAGGDDTPFDVARFERAIDAAIESLSPPSGETPAPPAEAGDRLTQIEPAAGEPAPETNEAGQNIYDDNVQFTVYRPRTLSPEKWQPMLAFAHLAERRPDAAADEPDPASEVARQAKALLDDPAAFRQSVEDSAQAIPRDGEILLVPTAAGAEFNPAAQAFRWTESVHRVEFRVRALPGAARAIHGRMSVYLGALLLAEINLSFAVGAEDRAASVPSSATPYRRIFASYSHKDTTIVQQCRDYAKAMGDRYLQDVFDLRSGEEWQPALEQLIRDADVFQLFWSWHALESPYVQQEWRFALGLQRQSFVRPVYWDDPLPSRDGLPPKELLALQFAQISAWKPAASARAGGTGGSPTPPTPPHQAPVASAAPPPVPADQPATTIPDRPRVARRPPQGWPTSESVTLSTGTDETTAGGRTPRRPRRLSWNVLSVAAALLLAVFVAQRVYRPGTVHTSPPSETVTGGGAPASPVAAGVSLVVTVAAGSEMPPQGPVVVQVLDAISGRVMAAVPLGPDRVAQFSSLPAGQYSIDVATPGVTVTQRPQFTVVAGALAPVREEIVLQRR